MATRSGLRPRRSTVGATATPAKIETAVTPARKALRKTPNTRKSKADMNKLSAMIDRASTPNQSNTIDAILDPSSEQPIKQDEEHKPTEPLHPSLDSKLLYPDLSSKTPTKRRGLAAATTSKKVITRRSLPATEGNPVTPTRPTDNSTVPKTTTFEFKFSAGLEEAGKKVLEELKISSSAFLAQMKEEAKNNDAAAASGTVSTALSGKSTSKRRRFSDVHKKQFDRMPSIADRYSAKRVKPVTPIHKKPDPSELKSQKPPKTLKRKSIQKIDDSTIENPFKPPATLNSDSEIANPDDSPLPSRKKAKFETPAPTRLKAANAKMESPKPLLSGAHPHGISRCESVKYGRVQSSLPRFIGKEGQGEPSTPSKPLAVATPMKQSTLLASPSKIRPPATIAKSATHQLPSSPSPVKISVPPPAEGFTFRSGLKAPVFDTEKLQKAATARPSVRFEDEERENEGETKRSSNSLFDKVVTLEPSTAAIKRKAVAEEEEEGEGGLLAPVAQPNKRVRLDLAESTPMKSKAAPQTSPLKPATTSSTKLLSMTAKGKTAITVKKTYSRLRNATKPIHNSRLNFLSTPKNRIDLTKSAKPSSARPRWR
ncbi:hypothetical protein BDZ91DRAFT_542157 [Kalaharituber pfeilii]|nr:hypothetical protein BDZ91DRAFT_542157 [Kalaharituber pfeilii]